MRPGGGVGSLGATGVLPITERVHALLGLGAFLDVNTGKFSARDAQLAAPLYVLNRAGAQLVVSPGVSLPLGSSTSGLEYTLLTTGSVDPTLSVGFSAGSAWMVFARAFARLPLHPGFDRVQQGLFGSGALQGARRIGSGGLSAGVSISGQTRRGFSSPGFVEIAPVARWSMPVGEKVGLNVGARVPVWTARGTPPYWFALTVGLNQIIRWRKPQPP